MNGASELSQAGGRTVISDAAVTKVAGIAARGVSGVYSLGSGSARAIGAIRDVVGATDLSQGIRAEVGTSEVAVDVSLVAEYGVPLQALANQVREAVYHAVQELVGLKVIEVNVEVNDVHVADSDSAKSPGVAKPPVKATERLAASFKDPNPQDRSATGETV
ncbi:Asp23/Gls24 family envelope stress response protein [Psychromicrobium lacuslunae]|uniref:Asp23/Gls24 family envelope stress response protein n=1 Tax=Psychromicrobium lacuslunae TaxID=1618207 RepID=UPI0005D35328|nr:Asp23/Gls24 family envelope stress response protein [Psychromicrobium lacuslunae]